MEAEMEGDRAEGRQQVFPGSINPQHKPNLHLNLMPFVLNPATDM